MSYELRNLQVASEISNRYSEIGEAVVGFAHRQAVQMGATEGQEVVLNMPVAIVLLKGSEEFCCCYEILGRRWCC